MSDFLDKAKEMTDTVRDHIADHPEQVLADRTSPSPETPESIVEDVSPGDTDGE